MWTDFEETSWQYQAGRALMTLKCDGPFKAYKDGFDQLYDKDMWANVASKAMGLLNKQEGGWTISQQVDLLASKQHDYGCENINRFGDTGVMVRLWDKISRYNNLVKNDADPTNESLMDTLKDIVGYCALLAMVRNGTFQFELQAT